MLKQTRFNQFFCYLFGFGSLVAIIWMIETALVLPRQNALFSIFTVHLSIVQIQHLNWFALGIAILILGSVFVVNRWLSKRESIKLNFDLIFWIELIIYTILICMFAYVFGINKAVDDSQFVLNAANQFKTLGNLHSNAYMYLNPQNLFLMFVYIGLEKIFGAQIFAILGFFILIQLLTIVIVYAAMKQLKLSQIVRFIAIQLLFLAVQLMFHSLIMYTDTLAIFFISLSFYCLCKYLTVTHHRNFWLILACLLGSLGYLSKGTVLIYMIAIAVFLFIYEARFKKFYAVFPIGILMIFIFAWNQLIVGVKVFEDANYGMPNTHYIMMGTSNFDLANRDADKNKSLIVGAYNTPDFQYSKKLYYDEQQSKEKVSQAQLTIFKNRISQLSVSELLEALNYKVATTWSSGDLKATFDLKRASTKSWRIKYLEYGNFAKFIYVLMTSMQLLAYVALALGSLKLLKCHDSILLFSNIFIAGYFCFILLWESNPRYSLVVLPFAVIVLGRLMTLNQNKALSNK